MNIPETEFSKYYADKNWTRAEFVNNLLKRINNLKEITSGKYDVDLTNAKILEEELNLALLQNLANYVQFPSSMGYQVIIATQDGSRGFAAFPRDFYSYLMIQGIVLNKTIDWINAQTELVINDVKYTFYHKQGDDFPVALAEPIKKEENMGGCTKGDVSLKEKQTQPTSYADAWKLGFEFGAQQKEQELQAKHNWAIKDKNYYHDEGYDEGYVDGRDEKLEKYEEMINNLTNELNKDNECCSTPECCSEPCNDEDDDVVCCNKICNDEDDEVCPFLQEAYEDGYDDGYEDGYNDADEDFEHSNNKPEKAVVDDCSSNSSAGNVVFSVFVVSMLWLTIFAVGLILSR